MISRWRQGHFSSPPCPELFSIPPSGSKARNFYFHALLLAFVMWSGMTLKSVFNLQYSYIYLLVYFNSGFSSSDYHRMMGLSKGGLRKEAVVPKSEMSQSGIGPDTEESNLTQDNQFPGQCLNLGPSKYKAWVLPIRLRLPLLINSVSF